MIIAARRTPIGEAGGLLRHVEVDRLAAPVLRAVLDDAGIERVDDVLLGNVLGPGGNPARVAALRAGLGEATPGMTIDRQCASGLSAITTAASMLTGDGFVLAGGVESPSTAPWRAWRPRNATEPPRFYQRAPFAPAEIGDPDMGPAADLVAAEAGIGRERQDAFAARSHARATAAQDAGRFDAELVPIGPATSDERPRRGFTPERLARFRPAFTADGTATAANSCGISDGAAAVLITSEQQRAKLGVPGLRLIGARTSGVDPNRLGLGAVPAMRDLCERHAPEVVEFNEAFAGQALACLDAAGLDEELAGPDGGAIALGHPWGASGAVLVVRLFSRMVRQDGPRIGMAALSSGGGLGVATMWERVG
ncbi:thiolase family protein [Saccharopolyspora mangrovi]|uniref:Probable acetyl-CoA acetyltransferase n=1 Tax=Saccharopolyspora mangrovi TaxID=3082379 RepID=A0ABU6A2U1_9PSEU|nr:thiolase family protein [Saccharopolyspora sp. S2-29]MEB3365863.1 thiolase family protein [Saccharopolyspora sp. S2-29]